MRHAVCVTPPGRSAIATIRVRGFDAISEFESRFHPAGPKELSQLPWGRVVFGHWSNLHGTQEELVVSLVSAGQIDIHCHGGLAAVTAILDSLASIGFETKSNDRTSPLETNSDLASELNFGVLNAPTRKIADHLLALSQGLFANELNQFRDSIAVSSDDYPLDELKKLRQTFGSGQFLIRPARVILAGAPNVGKSSINNSILGYSRSIIFDQPGTTRDVVSETTTIDGWSFEISDTAGLRRTGDAVETAGVELAKQKIEEADLTVWVRDPESITFKGSDFHFEELGPQDNLSDESSKSLHVVNKADLLDAEQKSLLKQAMPELILTDALTGDGIESLMEKLKTSLIDPEPPSSSILLFTRRQLGLVDACIGALKSGDDESAVRHLNELEFGKLETES